MSAYQKLKIQFEQLSKLNYIQNIMIWDESVVMPEGAGETLAHSLAALNGIIHKQLIAKSNKKLLDQAKEEFSKSTPSHWDGANLMWMNKKYLRASVIPVKLAEKLTKESFACQQAWRTLRGENNWRSFYPYLDRTFKIVKDIAKRYGDVFQLSPYDAMLDEYAPGFNQASLDVIFSDLLKVLPGLLGDITQKQSHRQVKLPTGPFDIQQQKELGLEVMKALQFNFKYGRLDVSHHPFCIGGATDVRITTRYNTHEFLSSLLGICHETGHGLYEQGVPLEWKDQPVGHVNSMAMHESQSLLIEMQVCKSAAFFDYISPLAKRYFGEDVTLNSENLYHIVTRVQPSLIRVDADEVTYPLHIILRYEIEKKLFKDEIKIRDLPAYWDELMTKYLGLSTLKNDKDGVMQDVHWPSGAFGYFPAYTLGRLIAAQLFATYQKTHPDVYYSIRKGDFIQLKKWLNENVYSQASSLGAQDFLTKVTGEKLNPKYFVDHIKKKYLV